MTRQLCFGILLLGVAGGMGCATTSTTVSADLVPPPQPLRTEVVELTRALVRAQPVNPPGDEKRAVDVLQQRLESAGITVDVHDVEPGRPNLLARIGPSSATSGQGIVLLCHTDVVPVERDKWTAPPFDAVVRDGWMYGRGVVDMLGMCAMETEALIALAAQQDQLQREVMLLAVIDEEVTGKGILDAIRRWPEVAQAEWAVGEASYIVDGALKEGETVAAINVAEKGLFQFRLRTQGPAGHGSQPPRNASTVRLMRAVQNVVDLDDPLHMTPTVKDMMGALGSQRGGAAGFVMTQPWLLQQVGRSTLESDEARVLVHNTCALTRLDAGYKTNVVPTDASAVFDCRLLPGTSPSAFRDRVLLAIDDPKVELDVIQAVASSSSPSDDLFVDVVRSQLKHEMPDVRVIPYLSRGFSDLTYLRQKGVKGYGLIPLQLPAEVLKSIHGHDERAPVVELEKGTQRLYDWLRVLAVHPLSADK